MIGFVCLVSVQCPLFFTQIWFQKTNMVTVGDTVIFMSFLLQINIFPH